jgi:hypothetical protein
MYYEDLVETAVDTEITPDIPQLNKGIKTKTVFDPNYEKYSVPFYKKWTDGKYYTVISIEKYGSGQQGTKIRNAVTGQRYPYLVGSSSEDLFFKVSDTTGRKGRKFTLTLFYDSPEQYENHCFTTVSQEIKNKWQKKHMEMRGRLFTP